MLNGRKRIGFSLKSNSILVLISTDRAISFSDLITRQNELYQW
ncbi:hypothetical protein Cflav_PD0529 [Pedosphaera parvula Ellin514]|uniref:Uncharacterized protein n=1 Tax=Pedosphaera parvula (strain Ellin514) TaxID=320771 RepID=B9XRK1_PEDPL|nr:hypothetical protein Cflav_PD0529 [Pedosphaera parvula Ellin514]